MATGSKLDGTSPKRCACGLRSVAGLRSGIALCPYHFTKSIWGADWARKCHPTHPEARNVKGGAA